MTLCFSFPALAQVRHLPFRKGFQVKLYKVCFSKIAESSNQLFPTDCSALKTSPALDF